VELAASAGLDLDPWQRLVLEQSLGEQADGRWSAFEVALIVSRQNGKGSILEARELAGLFLLGERLILHSAHEFKTAQEGFLRILSLIQNTPELDRRVAKVRTSHGEEGIELRSGQRLRFVARSRSSGRGFTGDCVILDEAYELDGRAMSALLPTLSARPNPQLWYASSAGMPDSEQLHAVRQRGLAGGGGRLAYMEWSAEATADLDDRAAWAAANPALGIRVSEEFVAMERDAMGPLEFARERLGIWEDTTAGGVFNPGVWEGLADTSSTIVGPLSFAVDMTPDRSTTSIAVAGLREDGLRHVEVVEHRNGSRWAPDRLAELVGRHGGHVLLDPGGPAGGLIPSLAEVGVEVLPVSTRDYAQACGNFYDLVGGGGLRHLGQRELNEGVAGARKRPLGDAWVWNRKHLLIDISPLVAVSLAVFAVTTAEPPKKPVFLW
jgi:hypothetical protein